MYEPFVVIQTVFPNDFASVYQYHPLTHRTPVIVINVFFLLLLLR